MERLNIILFVLVLSVYGCSTPDARKTRQVYLSDNGDTISLIPHGSKDMILIKSHGKEGRCDIIDEPQPRIHDTDGDTIFIWYDYMKNADIPDTTINNCIGEISIGRIKYVIKGVHNYFYNITVR